MKRECFFEKELHVSRKVKVKMKMKKKMINMMIMMKYTTN